MIVKKTSESRSILLQDDWLTSKKRIHERTDNIVSVEPTRIVLLETRGKANALEHPPRSRYLSKTRSMIWSANNSIKQKLA